MSMFTYSLVFCAVAVNISRVLQVGAEGEAAFREAAKPLIEECSKEHGVSIDALKSAKAAGSMDGINPCFLGCVYKKAEVFDRKGYFVLDNALIKLKKFVTNDEDFAKFADIGKQCSSVNDKPVSDGEAGCERGALLTACFLEHRAERVAKRFFLNERLTKINRQLFRKARDAASLFDWRFVWTKRGRILARRKPGDPTQRIRTDEDISRTFGPVNETV